MGAPGGLYRPAPQGYNGNPDGRGSQPSVSQAAVFSADCWGSPTGGPRRQVRYCSRASDDTCLVMGSWQQCRRLTDDHCRHSLSCPVNGVRGPWEGPADSRGADSHGSVFRALSPSSVLPLRGGSCRLRAVQVGRRGHSAPPTEAEVRAGMATVPRHDGDLQRYDAL